MAGQRPINHHRNPWIVRGFLIGMFALLVALLAYTFLKPNESAFMKRDEAALTAQMEAAEVDSAATAAKSDQARVTDLARAP